MDRLPKTSFVRAIRSLHAKEEITQVRISGLGGVEAKDSQPSIENVMSDGRLVQWEVGADEHLGVAPRKIRKALRRLRKQGIIQWMDWPIPMSNSGIAGRGDKVVAYTNQGHPGTTQLMIFRNPAAAKAARETGSAEELLGALKHQLAVS